ncbi:MAG: hypothetical protein MJZ15_03675 [Bacteroidales bacterium]|nr:hypothetical protein [Bacteroidales bacterium]
MSLLFHAKTPRAPLAMAPEGMWLVVVGGFNVRRCTLKLWWWRLWLDVHHAGGGA